MPKSILIRNVPGEVHLELTRRADKSGRSLQQYLLDELTRLAATPTMEEVLERITDRRLAQIDAETIVRDLAEERNRM